MRKLLCLIALLTCGAVAQIAPNQPFIAGQPVASAFGQWASGGMAIGNAGQTGSVTLDVAWVTILGGYNLEPFFVGNTVTINDGINTENVTITSSSCKIYSPFPCVIGAHFANTHNNRVSITSASFGLNEAVSVAEQLGGTVLVTPDWRGATSNITSASGQTNVLIHDTRAGNDNWYGWNGSAYVETLALNNTGPSSFYASLTNATLTTPTISGGSLSGTFSGNPSFSGVVGAKNFEQVRYADQFAGADIGAKINAAISDLGSSGGTIIIPRGAYTLTTRVSVTQPNVWLVGQGSEATEITCNIAGSDCVSIGIGGVDSSTPLQNGGIANLSLFGTSSDTNQVGVHITDTTGYVLRDVAIDGYDGTGSKGVELDNEVAWTERTVFDHVTAQNNTFGFYFYKGASTSSSFGYTSWLASHLQVNDGQVGVYVASGAVLYHSTLYFKANLQPFTNGAVSKLVEVAGSAVQNSCAVTGEFTGSGTGAGTNYGVLTDGTSQFSCSGFFDVARSVNSGSVFVGATDEDGAHSTLFGTLPDGTTSAWPIAIDRADTSLGSTHPIIGFAENNGLSKAVIVNDFHNCINDGRCGLLMYNSSGSTSPWLAAATLWGAWTNDGAFRTSGAIQGFGANASATSGFLLNWNETGGQGEFDIDNLFRAVQNTSPGFQFNVYDAGGVKHTVATIDRTGSLSANGASFNASVALGAGGTLTGILQGGTINATTLQQGGVNAALQGADINASNQVTATHLVSPLPASQGGTGVNSTAVFPASGTVATVLAPTTVSVGGSSIPAGSCFDTAVTVTGAATTNVALVSPQGALATNWSSFTWAGYVSAANTAQVHACNSTSGALTPTAMTFQVRVFP